MCCFAYARCLSPLGKLFFKPTTALWIAWPLRPLPDFLVTFEFLWEKQLSFSSRSPFFFFVTAHHPSKPVSFHKVNVLKTHQYTELKIFIK